LGARSAWPPLQRLGTDLVVVGGGGGIHVGGGVGFGAVSVVTGFGKASFGGVVWAARLFASRRVFGRIGNPL